MGEENPAQNPAQITSLPEGCGYELLKPIAVEVIPGPEGDSPYLASAPDIGLLVPGAGDTPEEARDDLAVVIVDQCNSFAESEGKGDKLIGLAKLCDGRIKEYIKPAE